jgi:hypothetical protein
MRQCPGCRGLGNLLPHRLSAVTDVMVLPSAKQARYAGPSRCVGGSSLSGVRVARRALELREDCALK